jgi:hypothetical protein
LCGCQERLLNPIRSKTWSQGGLPYFVIGEASAAGIDIPAKLFKASS